MQDKRGQYSRDAWLYAALQSNPSCLTSTRERCRMSHVLMGRASGASRPLVCSTNGCRPSCTSAGFIGPWPYCRRLSTSCASRCGVIDAGSGETVTRTSIHSGSA
eukprot:4230852-Amphidinium_carterae.1